MAKCLCCGMEFTAKRSNHVYCSSKCRWTARFKYSKVKHKAEVDSLNREAVRLYDSSYSVKEIANLIGKYPNFVYLAWKEAGLPKRLTKFQRNVKALREKGLISTEIAKATGRDTQAVIRACNTIGMPFTEEEKHRSRSQAARNGNQYTKRTEEERALYVNSFFDGDFSYVEGYKDCDSMVVIKCHTCNSTFERSMVSIRHKRNLFCPTCHKQKENDQEKAKEAERERQKKEAFWGQKFQQISFNVYPCKECGTYFIGKKNGYCSEACRRKNLNRKHDHRIERANNIDRTITLRKLYKRDKGICWICGGNCDYKDYSKDVNGNFITGADYPSIDHVYPLSKGGDHVWGNVRLAHHYCNTIKSNKVVSYG